MLCQCGLTVTLELRFSLTESLVIPFQLLHINLWNENIFTFFFSELRKVDCMCSMEEALSHLVMPQGDVWKLIHVLGKR